MKTEEQEKARHEQIVQLMQDQPEAFKAGMEFAMHGIVGASLKLAVKLAMAGDVEEARSHAFVAEATQTLLDQNAADLFMSMRQSNHATGPKH